MPEVENVKVAVRVRPFISFCLIIDSDTPKEPPKKFTYDRSYWSHDGYKELDNGYCAPDPNHHNGSIFCDQEKIYNELGKGILHNAWEGYNSTLFAYGQTGSGKSWSVVGYGVNKGIVPRFCEDMFMTIEERRKVGDKTEFEVHFNMLEIYNEVVRDLLNPSTNKKKGLKVREHPKKGFYAEGLKSSLVARYVDIENKIDQGTMNRSIATTNMNATSSRAHTIVGITLIQKTKRHGDHETSKTSVVNLVDLAGSERVATTGATGDRLKESAAINQSLSCLGKCIHALAERASGKNARVPYRESVLTRLLMNALGGNSKTIMIAAISPADINHEETFSTLRYADRAKEIKTVAIINEDPTDKLIRELREENDKLKRMLDKGAVDIPTGPGMAKEEIARLKKKWEEEMKAAMAENEREIRQMKQTYEEKLRSSSQQILPDEDRLRIDEEKKTNPHLTNLNFDPQLSGKIVHILNPGENIVGKGDVDIVLLGPCIQPKHAIIKVHTYGVITIEKCTNDSRILVNGEPVNNRQPLEHNDRVMFGTTQLYQFVYPQERNQSLKTYPEVTYEMAQEEIAIKAGINMASEDNSRESALLNKDLLEVLPGIEEANAISEELDKRVKFEIMLVSPQLRGEITGRTEVYVKMRNLETLQEFEWPKEKFLNRLYVMKEMYQNYEMGDEEWDLPPERDPFLEDPETDVRIGNVQVYLQPLAFKVELKEQLEIIDYKGSEVGVMNVEVVPCSPEGIEYTEHDDMFLDSPMELIGSDLHFIVKIHGCRGLPTRFTDINCRYKVYLDEEMTITEVISDTSNPDFNHKKMFSFHTVTPQMVEYVQDGYITIQVWGKQKPRKSAMAKAKGKSTKQMFQADMMNQANNLMSGFRMNGRTVDPNKQSIIVELLLMKKQQGRLHQRLENIRRLVEESEKCKRRYVAVGLVKELLYTVTPEIAEELLATIPNDEFNRAEDSSICVLL